MFRRSAFASIILLAALCSAVPAQQKPAAVPGAQPAQKSEPAAGAAPAPSGSGSDLVVLRVGGEPITEGQVLAGMNALKSQVVVKPDQQDKQKEMLFKGAVENLTIVALLKAEAKKQNVVVDKAKADEQYAMISKQENFAKVLALRGMTEADARKSIEESLAAQEILDRAALSLPEPSDADIRNMYEKNSFAVPERARLAQLFLKADPAGTPEQKAEIRKKLEGIRADIEAKKITFAEAADKYSQDPQGTPKGGEIGTVARAQVSIKALEEAIFSAAPETMTPVIEGPQGFHLVYVHEIKPAGVRSLEEVKPMLVEQIKITSRQAVLRKYVEELKSKASIETFMTAEEFEKRHPSE